MRNDHSQLELIAQFLNYGDLPETWRVPKIEQFSPDKTLYDYQEDALRCAAQALYLYYGKEENDWQPTESQNANNERKRLFADLYSNPSIGNLSVKKYETNADGRNYRQNPVFQILSKFISPQGEEISYQQLINRMCFWMATGSGKTLVMIKLIEYLHFLQKHREIPLHNILILAPSEHLLGQICRAVDEFNQSGLHIDLVPLREIHLRRQARLGDAVTVYYHRSDNISDVQKEALIDYRRYENDGKWYVLLDEAHKGSKEDSKRQAYYAVMARAGFLFNFSATFTDKEDIVTTVKKYNLEEFIENGHGKNIYLNEKEFDAFRNREQEINLNERRKIVLKSLITLTYVSLRVAELRRDTGLENLYHLPLMLTLVNSVNTDVENEKNDLWAFFQTLRDIATGEIDTSLFEGSKAELTDDWHNARLLFGEDDGGIIGIDKTSIEKVTIKRLREVVFLSKTKGALQFIHSNDNKELAFQMKNASAPFALIRIGDTSKWRNELLAGYEETQAIKEKSFFEGLEKSTITILMGSRSFFESWDSNRPNIINFINIGGSDAKKFVVQAVGRGVRIETFPGRRRRCAFLPNNEERSILQYYHDKVQPPETLFLFATNRNAVRSVLEGLQTEKSGVFESVEGFTKSKRPKVNGKEMSLLVPEYKEVQDTAVAQAKFAMSDNTLHKFKQWFHNTSDSVFAVRNGLSSREIKGLREIAEGQGIQLDNEKDYASLPFLQNRLESHLSKTDEIVNAIRELSENTNIVHFRKISAHLNEEEMNTLNEKIRNVVKGEISEKEKKKRAFEFAKGKIKEEEFTEYLSGKSEETFKDLRIKKLTNHYYLPVVLGDEKADYIQHVVKIQSEVEFLNSLENWLKTKQPKWDAWMFSKIDESLDEIYVPYYDTSTNEYRQFKPDFIFWMCKGKEYQIVFVDPKGTEYAAAYRKIDGYRQLYENNGQCRKFRYQGSRVNVGLLMFNERSDAVPDEYKRFWTSNPADVFDDCSSASRLN